MEIITTHVNADFDSVASMLAAKKLYPEAKLAFPGSQEKGLRDFFLQSTIYVLETERIRNIEFDKITRLVLVDIRQRDRIGRFQEILGKPGLEVHIYDHHPASDNDISGSLEVVREVGATTTILCELLEKKNVPITPDEATIMMMGIYEDTGSLTFGSTTPQDMYAAAFLLTKGANLNTVADMVSKELTAEQLSVLYELVHTATVYTANGVDVVIAKASPDKYISDFAVLVHKLRDMENINVLCALAEMEERVYLVARSRLKDVDVSKIALAFGGGGHATAASATIRGQSLSQVEENLRAVLKREINPLRTAESLMSYPVLTIDQGCSIRAAAEMLAKFQVATLPVMQDASLIGLISRSVVDKAIAHNLDDMPVKEYMVTEFSRAYPNTPWRTIQKIIVEDNQGVLPVVKEGKLVGVITRTDVLRALRVSEEENVSEGYGFDLDLSKVRRKNLLSLMGEELPNGLLELMEQAGAVAERLGYQVYAVGGFVRDLLLRYRNLDLDLVVEGDGIRFAKQFFSRTRGSAKYHSAFGTAQIVTPGGVKIDVASARREYYESPASLPVVELSTVRQDLYRRDFTMNTLAIRLNPGHFGEMIDFFGGQKDIKNRTIKVIHSLSFVEDPTRIFRALRFEGRIGFTIGKETAKLIRSAVKMGIPQRLSGPRIFAELQLILQEDNPGAIIKRMGDFDLLRFFHPGIRYEPGTEKLMESIDEVVTWFELLFFNEEWERWRVYFLGLIDSLKDAEFVEFSTRLSFVQRNVKKILAERHHCKYALRVLKEQPSPKNSVVYELLKPLSSEALLYMMARAPFKSMKKSISHFITHLRSIQGILTGEDLKQMGLPPGKLYKQVLGDLLRARLDGELVTREEEESFVRTHYLSTCPVRD